MWVVQWGTDLLPCDLRVASAQPNKVPERILELEQRLTRGAPAVNDPAALGWVTRTQLMTRSTVGRLVTDSKTGRSQRRQIFF